MSGIPDELSTSEAIAAIDTVLAVYPGAKWVAGGSHGRIVSGDRLISLSMATVEADAELLAWLDGGAAIAAHG